MKKRLKKKLIKNVIKILKAKGCSFFDNRLLLINEEVFNELTKNTDCIFTDIFYKKENSKDIEDFDNRFGVYAFGLDTKDINYMSKMFLNI